MSRTTDAIFADIANAQSVSDLAALWREMARVAGRDGSPAWAVTAAALLADQYTRDAEEQMRRLVRRAYEADADSVEIDVDAGLADVVERAQQD